VPGLSAGLRVTYVGHATALLEIDGVRLLTDPLLRDRVAFLRRQAPAPVPEITQGIDAVLLSHLHHDHVDLPSLRRLDRRTRLVAPRGAGGMLRREGFESVLELAAGEETTIEGVRVLATAADHPPGRRLHARPEEALGFALAGGRSAYFAGDTDLFAEMERLGEAGLDLALLPISGWGPTLGPGHLDPERAARAAALLRPRFAVPIHWGTLRPLGRRASQGALEAPAREFARRARELAPQVEVRLLKPGESAWLP
jgi:L-ascorbate metabolism protein UlaG (beta-lactamase superfamily)